MVVTCAGDSFNGDFLPGLHETRHTKQGAHNGAHTHAFGQRRLRRL
jgi:hypothetical protein